MITKGQMCGDQDFFQAVDELAVMNPGPEISKPLNYFLLRNNDHLDLRTITPEKYAEIMLNEFPVSSSARTLDEQLKQKGFKTTYKFSYQYNMTPQMRERISHDGYVLEYFHEVSMHPNFPREEKYSKQFVQVIENAINVSYWYAQFIWANNPNIYDYKNLDPVKDWYHILNFIIGASFEFHPLDIQYHKNVFANSYCRNQAKYAEQIAFKNWCKKNYDIDTGCLVLSDTNMEKLRMILTKKDLPYFAQVLKDFFTNAKGG